MFKDGYLKAAAVVKTFFSPPYCILDSDMLKNLGTVTDDLSIAYVTSAVLSIILLTYTFVPWIFERKSPDYLLVSSSNSIITLVKREKQIRSPLAIVGALRDIDSFTIL